MFKGDLERDLEGDLEVDFEIDLKVEIEGYSKGDFKKDMEGDLMSSSGLVQDCSSSGPGLVQVWFRLHLKFNSLELDSEVGQLVFFII